MSRDPKTVAPTDSSLDGKKFVACQFYHNVMWVEDKGGRFLHGGKVGPSEEFRASLRELQALAYRNRSNMTSDQGVR
jgi:hypothetical protein